MKRLLATALLKLLAFIPGWLGAVFLTVVVLTAVWFFFAVITFIELPAAPRGDMSFHLRSIAWEALTIVSETDSDSVGWAEFARALIGTVDQWLAIAVSIALIWRPLAVWTVPKVPGHVLVYGSGPAARTFVNINAGSGGACLAALPESDVSVEQRLRDERVPWVAGKAVRAALERSVHCEDATIVLADQRDTRNVACLETLAEILKDEPAAERVNVAVRIVDGRLRRQLSARLLQRREMKTLRINLFSDDEMRARYAARQLPVRYFSPAGQGGAAHLVVVGGDQGSEVMLVQLIKTMVLPPDLPVRYSLIDPFAAGLKEDFERRFPQLAEYADIEFAELDTGDPDALQAWVQSHADQGNAPTAYYIAGADAAVDLTRAMALEEAYEVASLLMPPACVLSASRLAAELHQDGAMSVLPADSLMLRTIDSVALVEDGDLVTLDYLDAMAERIHEGYLQDCFERGEKVGDRPSVYHWDELPEMFRDENRDQAEHNLIKLRLLALTEVEDGGAEFSIAADAVEPLSIAEHDRWLVSRYARNWVYDPVRNDDERKHPDIVSWADLPEPRREIDRVMVRQIPDLLQSAGQTVKPLKYCLAVDVPPESVSAASAAIRVAVGDEFQPVLVTTPATAGGAALCAELVDSGAAGLLACIDLADIPDAEEQHEDWKRLRARLRDAEGIVNGVVAEPADCAGALLALEQSWLVLEVDDAGAVSTREETVRPDSAAEVAA